MGEPKIHHYVPQCLLQRFCFQSNSIWYSFKGDQHVVPKRRNIKRVFKRDHYYTIVEDGEKSARIEKDFYGRVDDIFGKILNECESVFDSGNIPIFEGEALGSLRHIFSIFMKRNPDFIGGLEKRTVASVISGGAAAEKPEINELLQAKSELELEGMVKNARVRAQAQESTRVLTALQGLTASWAFVEPGTQLVIGSYPIARLTDRPSANLGSVEVELWLPVSPLLMLGLTHPKKRLREGISISKSKVHELNRYTFERSSEVGSRDYDLMLSLMKSKRRVGNLPTANPTPGGSAC